jgi:hypothetical protein
MIKKKKKIKIKVSLHRLYIYYKQLLHILHILTTFEQSTYILVNNQLVVQNLLASNELFSENNVCFKYFKFNSAVYAYLLKKKLFNLQKINNFFFLNNFNFILRIPASMVITNTFLTQLLNLNSGFVQFMYLKLPLYTKLVSLLFYKEFLEKNILKDISFKQTRLLVFYNILFIRLITLNIHIKNVTNNISIS